MVLVIQADHEKTVLDVVAGAIGSLPAPPAGSQWRRGTYVTRGETPTWFIQVRLVGGEDEQSVAERPLLDVRVWADGTVSTEQVRSAAARTLLGHLRSALRCRVLMIPTPLPDPADATKVHSMFTIQLLAKGVQS